MADERSGVQVNDDPEHSRYLITVDGAEAGGA